MSAFVIVSAILLPAWSVDWGPLKFSNKGVKIQPKFNFGFEGGGYQGGIGLGDLRDGVKVSADGGLSKVETTLKAKTVSGALGKNKTPELRKIAELVRQIVRSGKPLLIKSGQGGWR
jgi:hypothetical protein